MSNTAEQNSVDASGSQVNNPETETYLNSTVTNQIVKDVCMSVLRCHGVAADWIQCRKASQTMKTFARHLGVYETSSPTVNELNRREASGSLVSYSTGSKGISACRVYALNLSCSTPELQNAFDVNLTEPFQNMAEILGENCTGIFNP